MVLRSTNMGPIFFLFFTASIVHYLTSSSSIDCKFHAVHRYKVLVGQ